MYVRYVRVCSRCGEHVGQRKRMRRGAVRRALVCALRTYAYVQRAVWGFQPAGSALRRELRQPRNGTGTVGTVSNHCATSANLTMF